MHQQLLLRLTEYFDLCDLADNWVEDKETITEIAGKECYFFTRDEVLMFRDAARINLRGYCNVLRPTD